MKLWHISDTHLSFLKDGSIKYAMDKRKWSVGTESYLGYLDKISLFSDKNISNNDFVVITGDITHEMGAKDIEYSLSWLRQNVKGKLIICRGNHDSKWDPSDAELKGRFSQMYLMTEGDILSVDHLTFGCYSDHESKTVIEGVDSDLLTFARCLNKAAESRGTIGVMLGHYPVSLDTAVKIGECSNIKAFLSGHIHCTSNSSESGIDWTWYNSIAKQTDDAVIGKCRFSTGTTDVLLAKHGDIFKDVKVPPLATSKRKRNALKSLASTAFRCKGKMATPFERVDPFNSENTVSGYICREKGTSLGSLYITHVNGFEVKHQLVHATPKLKYPYVDTSDRKEYADLPGSSFHFADKWNGMNICFYKYKIGEVEFISAKSKGTPFVKNSDEMGNFLTLTREAMIKHDAKRHLDNFKKNKAQRALVFELCGNKEPHLVAYDFDIELKPLFIIWEKGKISPFSSSIIRSCDADAVVEMCKSFQAEDLKVNEEYRASKNLPHKYEYHHFATEGKVLYCLDENGHAINRTLYKIKPSDIEEVHWQTFDRTMVGRVKEAVRKIRLGDDSLSEKALQEELDMGPKEWGKFGKKVMACASNLDGEESRVIIMCGLPSSGKSTCSKILEKVYGWVRVNQDELKTRAKCEAVVKEALAGGKNVVIDRCNFNKQQRKVWVDLATEVGVEDVSCVWINRDKDSCMALGKNRVGHETIKTATKLSSVLDKVISAWENPVSDEGFELEVVSGSYRVDEVAKQLAGVSGD